MKNFILFAIISFCLCGQNPVQANDCAGWYALTAEEMAAIKPEFLKKHNTKYTVEVKSTPVKNQCQYGGCWMYGTLANVEAQLLKAKGIKANLSEEYLLYRALQERTFKALEEPGLQVAEAGMIESALHLIEKHGVVPAEVWKPKIPFVQSPHSKRILSFLNNRVAQFHLEVAKNPRARADAVLRAKVDLANILDGYVGRSPTNFKFRGKTYKNPKAFADSFLPKHKRPPVRISIKREGVPKSLEKEKPKNEYNLDYGEEVEITEKSMSLPKMEKAIVAALKKGKSVAVVTDFPQEFIDKKSGIMSLAAFHTPEGFAPANLQYRLAFRVDSGAHQMEIVGADLDKNGRVIKYKIKNSWGTELGEKGYFHMYADYFNNYIYYVVVP